ncbi:MAG: ATP-binding protein, partial [Dehalococcoidia bacterium]
MTCPRCGAERSDGGSKCSACGYDRGETISERAERRLVTVLFGDISGFTALSEQLDPEDVREIINLCLEELVSVVHRYGGTVDKFIGDAVMALFGAPAAHEDDPERACAAALEMRRGLTAVAQRLGDRLPNPLALHIGINTGMVVAGRVGSLARSDYTVLGDTVTVAARLEDLSENGQILVTETTREMTQHAFAFKALPPATVKGKREPIAIFELDGHRARRRSRRGLPGIETPFVGRQAERQALIEALDEMIAGRGGFITLSGTAGVGKSRLLRELRLAAEERGVCWVQAGASSLGQGGVLAIWTHAIRRLLAIRAGSNQPAESIVLRDGDGVLSTVEGQGTAAALAEVLGLTLPPQERARLGQLDESALRGQLFLAVRELLRMHTEREPLILVLEDLHWGDEASFDLLRTVVDLTANRRLLLIGTFRSEATTVLDALPAEEAAPGARRLHQDLVPLTEAECRALAEAVLGTDERLAPVSDLLVEQAEGNPLYLEEILRALAEQGAITPADGGWRLASSSVQAVLPPSLKGLLQDRIDRLPEQRKRLLQIAAVAGRRFPPGLIGEIAGDGADIAGQLDELVRDGFLDLSESTDGLRFRHALMQEAAYSSLLLRHRRSYHRRVAETLEAQPSLWPAPVELPTVLAYHWERAEEWARAGEWSIRAAEQARRTFAPAEAARMFARALTIANQTDDAALARVALTGSADAALLQGDAERALEALEEALGLEPTALERAALERRRGEAHSRLGMQGSAVEAYGRAVACLGDPHPEEDEATQAERARIRIQVAFAQLARGALLLARAAAEEAVRSGVVGADRADVERLLGVVDQLSGNPASATQRFEAALATAREIGDLPRVAAISEQLGTLRLAARETEAGVALLRDAHEQFRRLGNRAAAAQTLLELGAASSRSGRLAEAESLLRESIVEAAAAEEPALRARAGLMLGRVLLSQGRPLQAEAVLDRAGADDEHAAGEAALERALAELGRGASPEADLRVALAAAERAG